MAPRRDRDCNDDMGSLLHRVKNNLVYWSDIVKFEAISGH